jgi:hypothetical protein
VSWRGKLELGFAYFGLGKWIWVTGTDRHKNGNGKTQYTIIKTVVVGHFKENLM